MKKFPIKQVDALSLKVDRAVNFRDDYDLPSMMEEIRQAGRVLEPIHARKEDNVVLKGNRRTAAVHELLADPKLPSDLKKAIEKLDVIFYEDLTDREVTQIVLDHGSQKPLNRAETVKAVWRLAAEMRSEREIITDMFQLLARFTQNTRKAYEAQSYPEGPARDEYLRKWLHGTVGNYLMAARLMGDLVKEQLLLTETKADRKLTDEEQARVKFEVSRDRINKLNKAKNEDKESPTGWDPEKGGEKFNALIAEFIEEDKPGSNGDKEKKKVTPKQMEDAADGMKSPLRMVYLHCAGKLSDQDKKRLEETDTELWRKGKIHEAIVRSLDRIENLAVKNLLAKVAYGTEVEFLEALSGFLVKETVSQ